MFTTVEIGVLTSALNLFAVILKEHRIAIDDGKLSKLTRIFRLAEGPH